MLAWEEEKSTEAYKKRVEMSERLTEERTALKNAAHGARRALARGSKIQEAIIWKTKQWSALSGEERVLLDHLMSGRLARVRDECDAAFGWNQAMRTAMSSAAQGVGR